MSRWWSAIERELGARSELASDPWSHLEIDCASLTDEQRRHLTRIDEAQHPSAATDS